MCLVWAVLLPTSRGQCLLNSSQDAYYLFLDYLSIYLYSVFTVHSVWHLTSLLILCNLWVSLILYPSIASFVIMCSLVLDCFGLLSALRLRQIMIFLHFCTAFVPSSVHYSRSDLMAFPQGAIEMANFTLLSSVHSQENKKQYYNNSRLIAQT